MKVLIFLLAILPIALPKPIETETEKFECLANYLRDKKLLDKNFKYYVQSEPLECDSFVTEFRDQFLNEMITETTGSSSSEEDEETKNFKNLIRQNKECMKEQLTSLNYAEVMMKVYIYSKSNKLSKKQKKQLLAAAEHEGFKKVTIATSVCFPADLLGEMFDEIMKDDDDEENTLEDKQNDYCIRKYAVDNQLVDTTLYTVNMNPDNIDVNFNCTDMIEDLFEILEATLKEGFETEGDQPRRQLRCLSKTIRDQKSVEYLSKISVMAEVAMTEDQKKELRSEFTEKMKILYLEMIKCIT